MEDGGKKIKYKMMKIIFKKERYIIIHKWVSVKKEK